LLPAAAVRNAAQLIEKQYGVTVSESAKRTLLDWATANPDQIRRAVSEGWDYKRFIDAAATVLSAAANQTRSSVTLSVTDGLDETGDTPVVVGDADVQAAMLSNCPFFGC